RVRAGGAGPAVGADRLAAGVLRAGDGRRGLGGALLVVVPRPPGGDAFLQRSGARVDPFRLATAVRRGPRLAGAATAAGQWAGVGHVRCLAVRVVRLVLLPDLAAAIPQGRARLRIFQQILRAADGAAVPVRRGGGLAGRAAVGLAGAAGRASLG